ncbi:MAG: ABC transporter permease subunit [Anaerotruncus massiliensis (ex Togo et al. 2019)]
MPDIPIIVPFLVALAVCMLLGLFNGTVIAKFAIPPFIVTLGTQVIAWGVNLLYFDLPPNSSQPIGGVKKSITYMGSGLLGGKVPVIILIALAVTLAVWFILKKLRFGRNVYAVGGNAEAANVSGIKVTATLIGVYGIAGLLYGLAGFLSARGPARLLYGLNRDDAIASCVVGGVSNTGGIGTVPGMVVNVLIFVSIWTHLHRRQPVRRDYQGHHHYRGGRL